MFGHGQRWSQRRGTEIRKVHVRWVLASYVGELNLLWYSSILGALVPFHYFFETDGRFFILVNSPVSGLLPSRQGAARTRLSAKTSAPTLWHAKRSPPDIRPILSLSSLEEVRWFLSQITPGPYQYGACGSSSTHAFYDIVNKWKKSCPFCTAHCPRHYQ